MDKVNTPEKNIYYNEKHIHKIEKFRIIQLADNEKFNLHGYADGEWKYLVNINNTKATQMQYPTYEDAEKELSNWINHYAKYPVGDIVVKEFSV